MKYKILPPGAFSGALANNRFVVTWEDARYELDIESVSVGGMEYDVYDYKKDTNPVFRVPIDLRGGTFNVTLRSDAINSGRNGFYVRARHIMGKIIYPIAEDYYFGYLQDVFSDLKVEMYKVNDDVPSHLCIFVNVLPIAINQTELSHDNSNSTVKIQVTFSYQYADMTF